MANHSDSDKDIWLLGGVQLAQSFSQKGLIDEIILTIIPQTLEKGLPLGLNFNDFRLIRKSELADGLLQKRFLRKVL